MAMPSMALSAEESAGWDWRLSPLYYWSVNVGGTESTDQSEPPVDLDLFDFNFEGAFSLNFEGVNNNRWGFLLDYVGVSMASENMRTTLEFDYSQVEADGFYRTQFGNHAFDWLAGARYYRADFELTPISNEGKADWVDPVVGVRWSWPFASKWSLSARGDVGGFGIGSDLAWQTIAVVDWMPWEHVGFNAGVRALGLKYSTGSGNNLFEVDMTFWGPLLGLSVRW